MLYGLLNLSFWGYVIALLIFTQLTIAGVTIYLHRCMAHKALSMHPVLTRFFRFWLWMSTGMRTVEWVSIHRKHHAKCETDEDPHSPVIKGIKKVFWQGAELYKDEAKNLETLERYGKGCPDDWVERNVYSRYTIGGIVIMAIIDLVLFGIPGITIWALQMIWIPFWAAGVVNGIGHYWGYRNFECTDASRNVFPIGFFIGGEELHNNHHTFPNSAKLSVKWWEFDMGYAYITLFKWLGLAKVHKLPPQFARNKNKANIDVETLRVLFNNKFQIMSRYSKDVIKPIFRQEKERADASSQKLFHKAKNLLIREKQLVDEKGEQRLSHLLEYCPSLNQVYQYREQLQQIWMRTSASQKELLEALQEWCKQAEATGIEALQTFAARLKTYVPKPASV